MRGAVQVWDVVGDEGGKRGGVGHASVSSCSFNQQPSSLPVRLSWQRQQGIGSQVVRSFFKFFVSTNIYINPKNVED